ncbi:hypothetical protein [Streptomyces nojiriensis]|uniref:hypothetical protein n=1 Tax=Streptomyces nojiriensis TaxID=66374 RepID=UPI0035D66985
MRKEEDTPLEERFLSVQCHADATALAAFGQGLAPLAANEAFEPGIPVMVRDLPYGALWFDHRASVYVSDADTWETLAAGEPGL